MANPATLIPQAHVLTREEKSRGGKNMTLARMLNTRRNCNSKCPIYTNCPVMLLSETEHDGKCALKNQSVKLRERVINLLERGEKGIINELKTAIFDISYYSEKESSSKIKGMYFDKVKDFFELIYGKRIRQEVVGDQKIVVTWGDEKKSKGKK